MIKSETVCTSFLVRKVKNWAINSTKRKNSVHVKIKGKRANKDRFWSAVLSLFSHLWYILIPVMQSLPFWNTAEQAFSFSALPNWYSYSDTFPAGRRSLGTSTPSYHQSQSCDNLALHPRHFNHLWSCCFPALTLLDGATPWNPSKFLLDSG